jgi:transcription initiation factor TFIIIB Brf1 subunit/transcription initiation factor TFIIB
VIQGTDSCGYVLHNVVHDAKGVGVLVCDHAKGVIEDNIIVQRARWHRDSLWCGSDRCREQDP